jgi:hypothetical protein
VIAWLRWDYQGVTDNESLSQPPEPPPEQRSLMLEAIAAAVGTAAGEGIRDGIRYAAHRLTPPRGRHERGREAGPADDGHGQDDG